jgi:phosphatidylserine decarboxylase
MMAKMKQLRYFFRLHKEGRPSLLLVSGVLLLLLAALYLWLPQFQRYFLVPALFILFFFIQFFRHPKRQVAFLDNRFVYAPADGKVVAIEEVFEEEYFQDKRIQLSIFMSPLNVHVNRIPLGGKVAYTAYHPGKYLVAWHPKSSTENERTTTVIDSSFGSVMIRQIAGAVARRIVLYLKAEEDVRQGEQLGFIKFGSRVDVLLPTDIDINVELGQKVKANKDRLASW